VTVVFCDVVGSTTLGERQDPERMRSLMSRYFDEMAAVLERHGGTVGKFIGDAVMAVFGTPVLHEDDALRAVRAAAEMRDALVLLNIELERLFDERIDVRIGVNTGEVIVGDPRGSDTLVTGDAVNTAERLERSAGPGEILIGDATYRLAQHAIDAEALAPLTLKGKESPQRAYRVLDVISGLLRARPSRSPFVGREPELVLLRDTLQRAARDRACHLFTVLGPPGIGKSRLVDEVIRGIGPTATVLRGSCLPYGEGITFWPVIEVVRQAVQAEERDRAEDVRRKLSEDQNDGLAEGESESLAAQGVFELIGAAGASLAAEETFRAVRKLLEAIARRRPLVVVFDDIHWGEPTFLDLIEHIADWSRDAPILLVCIARPELLETRAHWGGGKLNTVSILLEPLTATESERLIHHLLGELALPEEVRLRVHEAAEGYPLFVEEMLSMLVEAGLLRRENGRWSAPADAARLPVPATINLLLASRLDRLPDEERRVLERASVEGKVFHRGAVRHLSGSEASSAVDRVLMGLVRKELIRPEAAALRGEDGFGFRHILIRDAAYQSIPKHTRAGFHEHYASWLEAKAADEAVEYEEFVGYHLEQAFLYRAELHRPEPADRELAARAGRHLAAAGSRARMRGDVPAAVKLLERAASLLHEAGAASPETLIELGAALVELGDLARASAIFDQATDLASSRGDARLASRATLERAFIRVLVDRTYDSNRLREVAEAAIPVFESAGDDLGIATALRRVAEAHWDRCHVADMEEVLDQALVYAGRARAQRETVEILELFSRAVVVGPRPVGEAIRRCRRILERARDQPRLEAWTQSMLAVLEAMRCHADEARGLYRHSQQVLADLGMKMLLASAQMFSGMAELIMQEPQAAEREFRQGYVALQEIGEQAQLSTMAAYLARALVCQERYEDVQRLTVVSEEAASEDDLASQVLWRGARARFYTWRREREPAERLAREAVALARSSDFVSIRADVLMDLAHILRLARPAEADTVVAEALSVYEAKGNTASAAEARAVRKAWQAATMP
jgi:class 3 adenylate cyclase/tetratricopeptide (TPR) repeat protein